MRNASIGDIVFLSTVKPGAVERDRFIFATFRIGEVSEDQEWGMVVQSDEIMDVRIPDTAAPFIRFWDYYRTRTRALHGKRGYSVMSRKNRPMRFLRTPWVA